MISPDALKFLEPMVKAKPETKPARYLAEATALILEDRREEMKDGLMYLAHKTERAVGDGTPHRRWTLNRDDPAGAKG